jgi:hypothetical protein
MVRSRLRRTALWRLGMKLRAPARGKKKCGEVELRLALPRRGEGMGQALLTGLWWMARRRDPEREGWSDVAVQIVDAGR